MQIDFIGYITLLGPQISKKRRVPIFRSSNPRFLGGRKYPTEPVFDNIEYPLQGYNPVWMGCVY